MKDSRCVSGGATLILLKGYTLLYPVEKASLSSLGPEQWGPAWGGNRPFACSCLLFPRQQRLIKEALMEDDKCQPTPSCVLCLFVKALVVRLHRPPPKKLAFFSQTDQTFWYFPPLFLAAPLSERRGREFGE